MGTTEQAWAEEQLRRAIARWEKRLAEQGKTELTIRTYVRDARAFIDDLTGTGHARPAVPASRRRVPARPAKPVRAAAVSSRATRGPSVAGPIPVPRALRRAFDAWVAEGAPTQKPIPWPRDRWKARLPQHAGFFDELPERIGRETVRTFTPSAADSPDEAVRALLAVMAWGAGRTGFWQWRTSAMLSCRDDAAECVQVVAATLHDAGPLTAYRRLGGDCRLAWLGTSFGTKYLALCQRDDSRPVALIHDDVMRGWLAANGRPDLAVSRYAVKVYEGYLGQMQAWADELGTVPETVEWVIFHGEQRKNPGSQWNLGD